MPRNSIGFTYRIPKYITGRQNYIGFTYNLPIFIYSVFDCNLDHKVDITEISSAQSLTWI